MASMPLLTRVRVRNFKSIADCDVVLGRLTFLVGTNGSGKSNFLHALRLIAEALQTTLDDAVRLQGGFDSLVYRGAAPSSALAIDVNVSFPDGGTGEYLVEIGRGAHGEVSVRRERAKISLRDADSAANYELVDGQFTGRLTVGRPCRKGPPDFVAPAPSRDRLYLVAASGLAELRPLFEMLAGMSFYDIAPESVRELQPADSRAILRRDGSNLAGVLERLSRQSPETYQRLLEYLGAIVPDLLDVRRESYGSHETLLFRQRSPGGSAPWEFRAAHMSDGTLRALALLVAVMQRRSDGRAMTVVGVEEPECAIHPAAMAAMLDALREAAVETQVLVTTQSPDVLDLVELEDETLLAVAKRDGASVIAPVDPAGVDVLQQRLYTPGEMLRMNHLEPAPAHPGPTPARALSEVRSA